MSIGLEREGGYIRKFVMQNLCPELKEKKKDQPFAVVNTSSPAWMEENIEALSILLSEEELQYRDLEKDLSL